MSLGIRTIVVDDSPVALESICSAVSRQPDLLYLGSATNGCEALDLARRVQPDLILLDLEMPAMGGLEVTSRVGRDLPDTQIVIVTGHDTPRLRKACYERGAKGFIPKEALQEELPGIVRQLFGNDNSAGPARG